jgi:site-specific DNA-methyltransferase (adenine-specific)
MYQNSTKNSMDTIPYVRRIFSSGNIKLINADCMDIMKQYPDKYFDLAVVDPPYGINIETSGTYFKQFKTEGWDNEIPNEVYFNELKRVSKNQIIWGGNYFLDYLQNTKCLLIWDKMIGEGMSFADAEIAWTSLNKPTRIKKLLSRSETGKIHPTEKPIKLYDWTLNKYAEKQMKIIDTHGGSFNSAISAFYFGISEFIGIEKNDTIFEKSVSNFIEKTRALKLDF